VNKLGKTNRGKRCLIPGFTLARSDSGQLLAALATWARLEIMEGWRTWGGRSSKEAAVIPKGGGTDLQPIS
jgi:hypothetical protein